MTPYRSARTTLLSRSVDTPIGELRIVADGTSVVAILWDEHGPFADGDVTNPVAARSDAQAGQAVASDQGGPPVLDAAARQLGEYFDGDRTEFDLPLAPAGTEFQRAAWAALREIPFGTTVTYGEQADRMGDRNKARAVGAANGQNPIPIIIPCHRVVGSDGSLTGFAGGIGVKRWLLDHETGQGALI